MNRYRIATCLLLLCTPALAQGQAGVPSAGDLQRHIVLTDTSAYALLPAELVASPMVTRVKASANGRYLLVERQFTRISAQILQEAMTRKQPPPGEVSLVLWDSKTHESRTVWKGDMPTITITQMEWMTGTDTAFALIHKSVPPDPKEANPQFKQVYSLLRISAGAERAQVVGEADFEVFAGITLKFSPIEPLAGVERTIYKQEDVKAPDGTIRKGIVVENSVSLMRQDGRIGPSIPMPKEAVGAGIAFDSSGNPLILATIVQPGKKSRDAAFSLDPRTGQARLLNELPKFWEDKPESMITVGNQIRLKQGVNTVKEEETSQQTALLWLESISKSPSPRTVVAWDAFEGRFLKGGDGIIYQSQGALWVTPILSMSKEQYAAMQDAAKRMVVLNNAKQVGLGLLMYAQDYDEKLPNGDGINDKISPYIKNSDVMQGFVYTYGGGALASIQSPSEQELGYVNGPGGQAIIYADGHVKWKNN
jgi:hypothetical protein